MCPTVDLVGVSKGGSCGCVQGWMLWVCPSVDLMSLSKG